MTNITITTDSEKGKLLLIARERFKKYVVRNERAAEIIRELANSIKIQKVVESETTSYIRCEDLDIAIDSSDKRIYRYTEQLRPLIEKALEFEEKKNKKDGISSKVTRENVIYRSKVVDVKPEPRAEEFRAEVKKRDLKKVILDRLGELLLKVGVTVIGAYFLVAGSVWALNKALNPEPPKVPKSDDTSVVTEVDTDYRNYDPYEDTIDTTSENTLYLSPDEEVFDGVEFSYNNRCNTEKAIKCKDNYQSICDYYSEVYGVDPRIAIGIATQERGVHSSTKDSGGGVGLFQIQESVWVGHEISAFNHITGQVDKLLITKENIGDLNTNIRIGCMVLANCYQQMRGNIVATIQCYNYGYGNMVEVIRRYCVINGLEELDAEDMKSTRLTDVEKRVLEDQKNIGWTEKDIIKIVNKNGYTIGDPDYLPHIMSYVQYDDNGEFTVTFKNKDGKENSLTFRNMMDYSEEIGMKR